MHLRSHIALSRVMIVDGRDSVRHLIVNNDDDDGLIEQSFVRFLLRLSERAGANL